MQTSLKGNLLPESAEDGMVLATTGAERYKCCFDCKQPFTTANVRTRLGWRETQISGTCEDCFDKLFAEPEGGAQ